MPDLEFTVNQAARELGLSPRTVRRRIDQGRLVARTVDRGNLGYMYRVSAESVRRLAADSADGQQPKDTAQGQPLDTVAAGAVLELTAEVRSLREENAEYRQHLERLTIAFTELQQTVQRLLPAAPAEKQQLEEKVRELEQELVEQKLNFIQRAWQRLWEQRKGGS